MTQVDEPRLRLLGLLGNATRPAPPTFQEMAAFAELARSARAARPSNRSRRWWKLAR